MKHKSRSAGILLLCLCIAASLCAPVFGVYLPDVTPEMSQSTYWSDRQPDPNAVLMTAEEIAQRSVESYAAHGVRACSI